MISGVRKEEIVDAQRVQQALTEVGVIASLEEAWRFWEWHSRDFDAGWLYIPGAFGELVAQVREYLPRWLSEKDRVG